MPDHLSIMSIRELIDAAFGDTNMNIVNHKLIQTILIILARQLRLLERRVEVEVAPGLEVSSGTSISITEIKLHANVARKKKNKVSDTVGPGAGPTGAKAVTGPTSDKGAAKSKIGVHAGQTGAKVTTKATYEKTSSTATKSTTDKSKSDKTSTEKSSAGLTSSTTKSSTDKSTTDKSTSLLTSSDKTSTEKSSSYKTSSYETTEKSSSDKSKSTTETTKSSSEKKTTSEEKTSSSQKTSSATKSSTEPSSTDKVLTEKKTTISAKLLSQDYQKLREDIEEQRERVMRIIHQRTDSREERYKTPTPMASMESMEKQYEKLLIVERVPTDGIKAAASRSQAGLSIKTPRLSVVTQEEFSQLATTVRQLQEKFKIAGVPGFPENAQLMNELRKGASLTDAMAALQLSARIEAANNALERMMEIVIAIIKRIYVDNRIPAKSVEDLIKKIQDSDEDLSEIILAVTSALSQAVIAKRKSTMASKSKAFFSKESILSIEPQAAQILPSKVAVEDEIEVEDEAAAEVEVPAEVEVEAGSKEPRKKKDTITYEELDNALQELYDECLKMVTTATNRSNTNANSALKIANRLEGRLDESLNVGDRMLNLEKDFAEYAEQINILDTGLSSQMTNYQEQLTQMQHDLESGLEAMAEALANTGGDTAAVAELNTHFTNLQTDLETAAARQKELRNMQNALSLDLQSLWKQIEILRETKSDRDEVADALKDKAGLGALNGLVSRQEFDAVRGDFEKRIGSAYDKFNNQEIIWQKAIDDLTRELNEKADWIQVVSLQGSINQYLDKFKAKISAMEEVVGEPRAAAVSRRLHREAECLSCATPAHMDLEEYKTVPTLPAFPSSRPSALGADVKSKPKGDGDHGDICYPGLTVPHAVDPRAHVCHRYCGGSHTLINNTLARNPAGMIISPALRDFNTAVGTDGKLYMVDEDKVKKPCIPCNKRTTTPEPSEAEPAPKQDDFVSDAMSLDFRQHSMEAAGVFDMASVTPPPPMDDD